MLYKTCIFSLILCAFTGVLRAVDLLLFSEKDTYFVIFQSVWLRYAILAIIICTFFYLFRKLVGDSALTALRPNYVIFGILALLSFVCGILAFINAFSEFVSPTTNFGHFQSTLTMLVFAYVVRVMFAASLIIFGVFCTVVCIGKKTFTFKKTITRTLGLLGAVAFCLLCTLRYAQHPASVHRIVFILSVCSALAALIFITKLLGVMFKAPTPKTKQALISSALTCFLMCTCIELPQTLLLLHQGFNFYSLCASLLLGFLGILGAFTALEACK